MVEEGIKFFCNWSKSSLPANLASPTLVDQRNALHELGFIGEYPNGIGYGNISVRLGKSDDFLITAAATGSIPVIDPSHICHVHGISIEENCVFATGLFKPSSESLTHAACYQCNPRARAVIHIHHQALWNYGKTALPTTPEEVPYGTPEMADAIRKVVEKSGGALPCTIAMAGHKDGVIAIGASLEEATAQLVILTQAISANP